MILWLGEILHHESLFWGSQCKQSKPNRSRGEAAPFSSHLSHNPGDHSNNSSSSSFHLRSSVQPLYRRTPQKTDISFQCEEMQQMKSYGKTQKQERNTYFYILFLKEGIEVGNGTGPRAFLEILPPAKKWSIMKADLNFQHLYFCLIVSCWCC